MSTRDFRVVAAAQVAGSVVRVTYGQFPLQVSDQRPNDALRPDAYALAGPGSVRVALVRRVSGDLAAFDLVCSGRLSPGTWRLSVGDVRTYRGERLRVAGATFVATSRADVAQATDVHAAERMRKAMPHLPGHNWDALRAALGAADDRIADNVVRAGRQVNASTASGTYLDARAAAVGLQRPADVGMTDAAMRRLTTLLTARRCVPSAIDEVLEIFYGSPNTRPHLDSAAAPYALEDGDDLVLRDGQVEVACTWAEDLADTPGAATAPEVAAWLTRQMRTGGSAGHAEVLQDPETGVERVRAYAGSQGLSAAVACLGGRAQLALGFPSRLATQPGALPTWDVEIVAATRRVRFTSTGDAGTDLSLVRVGDLALVYGAEFSAANRGSRPVVSVSVSYVSTVLTQVFEVEGLGAAQSGLAQVAAGSLTFWRPTVARHQPTWPSAVQSGGQFRVRLPSTALAPRGYLSAAYLPERAALTATSLVRATGGLVTVAAAAHGLAAGDLVEVSGARGSTAQPSTIAGDLVGPPLKTSASLASLWSPLKDPATARLDHAGVALADGRALLVGGHTGAAYTTSCELFGIATTATLAGGQVQHTYTWATAGALPVAHSRMAAVRLDHPTRSGHVLSVGGYDGAARAQCYLYVPVAGAAGAWAATGSLSTARSWATASELADGRVLACGGLGMAALASCERWSPMPGTWASTGAMALARYRHAAVVLPNGSVLACGGLDASGVPTHRCEVYDPAAGTWASTGAMSLARYGHGAVLLPDGKILVAGGLGYLPRDAGSPAALTYAEVYDPAAGTWSPAGRHAARGLAQLVATTAGALLCGGTATTEVYDASAGWALGRASTSVRSGAVAVRLADDRVLLQGGSLGGTTRAAAYLHVPATEATWSGGLEGVFPVETPTADTLTFSTPEVAKLTAAAVVGTVRPVGAAVGALLGPHVWDEASLAVRAETTATTVAIGAGQRFRTLVVADATAFPDAPGYLALAYGEAGRVGPLRYLGRASPTELALDRPYEAETGVPVGTTAWLLEGRDGYVPDPGDGSLWATASTAGRTACAEVVTDIAAAGYVPEITIIFPNDEGLGKDDQETGLRYVVPPAPAPISEGDETMSAPTPDPWADIPLVLHLAAGYEDVADGYTFTSLADQSSVEQDLTVTGTLTMSLTGGPGGTPCYVFPTGAYATRLDPTLPQGTSSPGFALLAVVKLMDLSGYPEILEMGLADRTGDAAHHNYQHAIAGTGALYSSNTGGDSERLSTAGVVTTNTWTIVGWRWTKGAALSSTNPAFLVNGTAVAAASGTGTSTPSLTREAFRVGGSLLATPAQFLLGSLAELVLIPTDDAGVFAAAATILESKYGL